MAETLATYSVPEHHVDMFTGNVQAALARKGGVLRSLVSTGSYKGDKIQVVDFLGPLIFTDRDVPYADTTVSEPEHTSRWITGKEHDCAVFVDRLDTLKMIYDPSNPYVERMREAAARKEDQVIMDKFFADAKAGREGDGVVSLPAADIVVHGSAGMTVAKLRSLRKLIKKRHVDLRNNKPLIAVTCEQTDNLLSETTVNSIDYNTVKPLVDGEVTTFMGFNFIPFEDDGLGGGIPTHVDTGHLIRECPVWVPGGMHYGTWEGLAIVINNRPDKNNIKQIHGTFTDGATRIEEGRVFKFECQET
jgi:hypothetical protein